MKIFFLGVLFSCFYYLSASFFYSPVPFVVAGELNSNTVADAGYFDVRVSLQGCYRISCQEVAKIFDFKLLDSNIAASNTVAVVGITKFDEIRAPLYHTSAWSLGEVRLNSLIEDNAWIEKVIVVWDGILSLSANVIIKERKPDLVIDTGMESWLASLDGFPIAVLSRLTDPDLIVTAGSLPRVSFAPSTNRVFGDSMEARYSKALYSVKLITHTGMPFSPERYDIAADGSLRVYPVEINFPSISLFARNAIDLNEDLRKFRLVLRDLRAKGEVADNVDLRFANRAVVNYVPTGDKQSLKKMPSVFDLR